MSNLFGDYYVKPTMTAITRGWKLCNHSVREYQKLRRHGLKLASFPDCGDWDWIKTLPKQQFPVGQKSMNSGGKSPPAPAIPDNCSLFGTCEQA